MLTPILTSFFTKKEGFLQLFVAHVHITYQMILKGIIFRLQTAIFLPKNILFLFILLKS